MTSNTCDLSRWKVDGQPFVLACSDDVIEQLRRWALTASSSCLKRGILWGRRNGDTVHVTGVTSESDSAEAGDQIQVGWFQAGLDTTISLSAADRRYFDEQFPDAGGFALMLKPMGEDTVRAGVFFRELNGGVRAASSYQEVNLMAKEKTTSSAPGTYMLFLAPSTPTEPRKRWLSIGTTLVTAIIVAAFAGSAILHFRAEPPASSTPSDIAAADTTCVYSGEAMDLKEQNRRLRAELDTEKIHNRRLEATLVLLRDRR